MSHHPHTHALTSIATVLVLGVFACADNVSAGGEGGEASSNGEASGDPVSSSDDSDSSADSDSDSDGGGDDEGSDDEGSDECADDEPRAPLRRLTRFEYSNTIRDLLGDTTKPGNLLPSEQVGNGFGNDADAMSTSTVLVEQYANVGEKIARRAMDDPDVLAQLVPCAVEIVPGDEADCAKSFIAGFTPAAFRRPVSADERSDLFALYEDLRALSPSFDVGLAALIEAILQMPDFLYRLEWGREDGDRLRPTGHEMATRLAYLFWGSTPDAELLNAASGGELEDDAGIASHATRLLADPRARPMIRFFFDNYLPISSLAQLERDPERYPTFNASVGAAMREEIQHLLQYEIFEGGGTWAGALTAPHTFVNSELATYYGIVGDFDDTFVRVPVDTTHRAGILASGGLMAGTTHSNETSPVVRGSYVVQKLMCQPIPLPPDDILDQVKPPDPSEGPTARDRYAEHSKNPVCAACHHMMDPVGFGLENFDAVGLWRDRENDVLIDATGVLAASGASFDGPVELAEVLAATPEVQNCFATTWGNYAFGLTLGEDDVCTQDAVESAFSTADHNVQEFLVSLTQTDAFLYLPTRKD